ERSSQPVDLIDHHDIDLAGADIGKQSSESWPLQGTAREPPVIIVGPESPALMGLALDISFCRLALGIERVEVLLEAVLGRLPGVNRAAEGFALVSRHGAPLGSASSARACRRSAVRSSWSR